MVPAGPVGGGIHTISGNLGVRNVEVKSSLCSVCALSVPKYIVLLQELP